MTGENPDKVTNLEDYIDDGSSLIPRSQTIDELAAIAGGPNPSDEALTRCVLRLATAVTIDEFEQ
jgi:hypothetical protein